MNINIQQRTTQYDNRNSKQYPKSLIKSRINALVTFSSPLITKGLKQWCTGFVGIYNFFFHSGAIRGEWVSWISLAP